MLTPAEFSRQALLALDASEGRSKRRKRDQTPDRLGMDLKRELLQRVAEEAPAPDEFEGWLLQQVILAPASGPVRAMGADILNEYRLSCFDPSFEAWLAEGAPSADALAATSEGGEEACAFPASTQSER
ncbi:MAG: type III secretion fhipep protein [Anaerolineae bacterium]|nr:type III secretion fhipep protein [Anaerolineae bacterium]